MNIYIYSDESGVFDHVHNDFFIFGGLILVGEDCKNDWSRKYAAVENTIRQINKFDSSYVKVEFCDSSAPRKRLVRGADFVANKVYYLTVSGQQEKLPEIMNLIYTKQP